MASMNLGGEWTLYYRPEVFSAQDPDFEDDREEDDCPDTSSWPHIKAAVPGDAYLDLARAGIEGDPFYDQNLYNFRKYEFYEWVYEKTFKVPMSYGDQPCFLRLGGVNTVADIYLNGEWVDSTENMLIAHEFDVSDFLIYGEENTLKIHIHSPINSARKESLAVMNYTYNNSDEYTRLRMPPSAFGWDIMPRLLSAGLWRDVTLETREETRLDQVYIATVSANERQARLTARVRFLTDDQIIEGYSVRLTGRCEDSAFSVEAPFLFTSGRLDVTVPRPRLWWPAGYGEANLYDVTVTLMKDGEAVDRRAVRFGIRRFEIEHRLAPGDEGEFKVYCNGVPILCKGSNWVPLDAMHSRDAGRYEKALKLFKDSGCNIVRCWGGNVYEDHQFFDLCDRYGIMVWQDFVMACAMYEPDLLFRRKIHLEAETIVKEYRNHACILLWAGDNEVDEGLVSQDYPTYSNRYNALTREVLPEVVRAHDPYRLFLPSSPFIPEGIARYDVPEQHNWGARAYFKDEFYKNSSAHFISECGYHGCPQVSSLKRFIPEDRLTPWLGNDSWVTHSTEYLPKSVDRSYDRIRLMTDQVRIMFGEVPDDLAAFSRLSQIVQAEAKKFFIERTRIKKWRRTGIIWWNMLDGWPQISDAVVDYYFTKKLAYHYIRRVQRPICLMMDELVDWTRDIVLGNDSRQTKAVSWRVEDGDTGETLLSGETVSPAGENVTVGSLREMNGDQKLYILRWTVDGVTYANHYMAGNPHFDADKALMYVEKIRTLEEPFTWEE